MSTVNLTGYASVFNEAYSVGPYVEIVAPGAFTRSLSDPNLDCVLRIEHRDLPLARTSSGTMQLSEDDHGLHMRAQLDADDPDVKRIVPKIKRGDLGEMSFAFRADRDDWSSDYKQRTVRSANIHRGDVAIVTYGASPTTSLGLRAFVGDNTETRARAAEFVADRVEARGQLVAVDGERIQIRAGNGVGLREERKQYSEHELNELGKQGKAFPRPGGGWAFPVNTREDLINAIHLVGQTNLDKTAVRRYLIRRAKALGAPRLIPTTWAADGSLRRTAPIGELQHRASARYLDELELEVRASKVRRPGVSDRDRYELQWRARQQASTSHVSEGDVLRMLTSRSYAEQELALAKLRRK